jgi:5'(3')-deoxyribonucleotidase
MADFRTEQNVETGRQFYMVDIRRYAVWSGASLIDGRCYDGPESGRLKIGVDIDSVVCEMVEPLLKRINNKYNTNFNRRDIREWNWVFKCDGFDIDGETEIHEAMDTLDFISNLPVIAGAQNAIEHLSKNNSIMFITSRRNCLQKPTLAWIKKNFGDYPVRFTDDVEDNKNGYAVDILIDDAAHHVEAFVKKNEFAVLFDQPWNRDVNDERILRVDSWRDIINQWWVIEVDYERRKGRDKKRN